MSVVVAVATVAVAPVGVATDAGNVGVVVGVEEALFGVSLPRIRLLTTGGVKADALPTSCFD